MSTLSAFRWCNFALCWWNLHTLGMALRAHDDIYAGAAAVFTSITIIGSLDIWKRILGGRRGR